MDQIKFESKVANIDEFGDAPKISCEPVSGIDGDEIKQALGELMGAFEDFKQANDERLLALEKRGGGDVVTEEKLARLNGELDRQQRRVDDLMKESKRRANHSCDERKSTHKHAFEAYVRKGLEAPLQGLGIQDLEGKALSVGSEADGGYLVPEETEIAINRSLNELSPLRAISGHVQISATTYKRPVVISGAGFGWVGEATARPQTESPQLAELAFPAMELYAMPAATGTLLDDAAIDIDAWLAEEVQLAFAAAESAAFVSGDGVNQPKGLLSYTTVDETAWNWGKLGVVTTGVEGGFMPDTAADALIDLIYALKSPYRLNSHFVMNRLTQAEVRKLKDGDGNYLWQPSHAGQVSPSLMGYPLVEAEEMPDIAPGSLSIAFGDFRRGYLVVDRANTRVLRDRYSAKPYVLFYTTKRVGGGVQDFNAIKLLSFAT